MSINSYTATKILGAISTINK